MEIEKKLNAFFANQGKNERINSLFPITVFFLFSIVEPPCYKVSDINEKSKIPVIEINPENMIVYRLNL